MQEDGNLVLTRLLGLRRAMWSSGTYNRKGFRAPYQLCVQPDGNMVIYDGAKKALWASNTANRGTPPHRAAMQNDGNFVLYDSKNSAIWATNTRG